MNKSITVKSVFIDDIRRFAIANDAEYSNLHAMIQRVYGIKDDFTIRYLDDEKEMVTVTTDLGLHEAFALVHSGDIKVLKFHVALEQCGKPTASPATMVTATTTTEMVEVRPAALAASPADSTAPSSSPTEHPGIEAGDQADGKPNTGADASNSGGTDDQERDPVFPSHEELCQLLTSFAQDERATAQLPEATQVLCASLLGGETPQMALDEIFAQYPAIHQHPSVQRLLAFLPQLVYPKLGRLQHHPQALQMAAAWLPSMLPSLLASLPMVLQHASAGTGGAPFFQHHPLYSFFMSIIVYITTLAPTSSKFTLRGSNLDAPML